MCGICGIVALTPLARLPGPEVVRRMTDILRHRGPDDEGFHFDPSAALGHRPDGLQATDGRAEPVVPGRRRPDEFALHGAGGHVARRTDRVAPIAPILVLFGAAPPSRGPQHLVVPAPGEQRDAQRQEER